jgi:hypothetical protein
MRARALAQHPVQTQLLLMHDLCWQAQSICQTHCRRGPLAPLPPTIAKYPKELVSLFSAETLRVGSRKWASTGLLLALGSKLI